MCHNTKQNKLLQLRNNQLKQRTTETYENEDKCPESLGGSWRSEFGCMGGSPIREIQRKANKDNKRRRQQRSEDNCPDNSRNVWWLVLSNRIFLAVYCTEAMIVIMIIIIIILMVICTIIIHIYIYA